MPDFQQDFLASFASTLSAHVDSMLQSITVGISHPIGEFPIESGKNAAYVLYSDRGLPMGAGTILASRGVRESARIIKDVEAMGTNGFAATYRLVEAASESVAIQVAAIVNDLFSVVLPLSARLNAQHSAGEATEAPITRRGRTKGAGKGGGRKGAGGRRGRPRKVQAATESVEEEAPAPRRRGRPAKVQAEGAEETLRRRGRPRKAEGEAGVPPRRRGRPPASEGAAIGTKHRGRPPRDAAVAPEAEGEVRAVPKPTGKKRGRPTKEAEVADQTPE